MTMRLLVVSTAACLLLNLNTSLAQPGNSAQVEFFEKNIRPLFLTHCLECHGNDAKKIRGGLRMTSRAEILKGGDTGPSLVPGDVEKSLLVHAVRYKNEDVKMPPKGRLKDSEIALLEQWIKAGAVWPDAPSSGTTVVVPKGQLFTEEQKRFWAFQPMKEPVVPAVKDAAWVKSPIDAFILSALEAKKLTPAPVTDKRTLLRRVTFNLTGLPPTVEEIDAFLQDSSPNAFEKVIDRLLASPAYGERWGRHWLDVARYADSNGLDENTAFGNAYRYRDYVIKSLNEDKPYNTFVMEQIAGDLMPDAAVNPDRITGTGFLVLGPKLLAEPDKQKMKMDIADEQLDTLGKAFLGLTMGCARCHDHKFDPIPTRDYYSLLGMFTSTRTMKGLNTVAEAFERRLPTGEALEVVKARETQIADKQKAIQDFSNQLRNKVLTDARNKVAAYLLASADARDLVGVARMRSANEKIPGAIVIEAEKYNKGTASKTTEGYGKNIGVILSVGPENKTAEYNLTIPKAGEYDLEIRYAAVTSRPVKISLDGKVIFDHAIAGTTGGWNPENQAWRSEGTLQLKEGKQRLTLEAVGILPHIDKFALIPSRSMEKPTGTEAIRPSLGNIPDVAKKRMLIPEFITGWAKHLAARKKEDPIFAAWVALQTLPDEGFEKNAEPILAKLKATAVSQKWPSLPVFEGATPKSLGEFADRYGRWLLQADLGKALLQDGKGPFSLASVLPNNPEMYYPQEVGQLSQLNSDLQTLQKNSPPAIMVLAVEEGAKYPQVKGDGKPRNLLIQIRGNYLTAGEEAPAIFPRIIAGENQKPIGLEQTVANTEKPEPNQTRYGSSRPQSGRLELAQWMTDPKHPLTARVMVNRIWQHHFGEGLVRSPDNFGKLGERPTHPELLDWLALRFVEDGWSMKKMHKRILMSQIYQTSHVYQPQAALVDPDNRLLWRFHRQRLEAEAIRDSMLALAGNLDNKLGGTLLGNGNFAYVSNDQSVNTTRYDGLRRSIYLPVIRNAVFEFFQVFDFVEPSVMNGKRAFTVVAPQALFLMNSPFAIKQSEIFAQGLLQTMGDDPTRIRLAYNKAFTRLPNAEEIRQAQEYIQQYENMLVAKEKDPKTKPKDPAARRLAAWQSFCQILMASSEFIYLN